MSRLILFVQFEPFPAAIRSGLDAYEAFCGNKAPCVDWTPNNEEGEGTGWGRDGYI